MSCKKIWFKSLLFIVLSMMLLNSYAQNNILSSFNQASQQPVYKKIYVHTDKSFYIPGEVVWFKIYNADAAFIRHDSLEKIAYAELISSDKKPVLQAMIELKNGDGSGSFFLPASLPSGNYLFRCYTNAMKNAGEESFFSKIITLINPLKNLSTATIADTLSFTARFFPEGGNLVNNIQSKIGVKVTDSYGKGVNANGTIKDESNNQVAAFSTLKFGMGSFYFKPDISKHYTAYITVNNRTYSFSLPEILAEGMVMHVNDSTGEMLSVSVETNSELNASVYLAVINNNRIDSVYQSTFNSNGKTEFAIDKNNLKDGITTLTLIDKNQQPVCERLYFKKPGSTNLNLFIDSANFITRQQVNISIADSIIHGSNLSAAVFLVDSLQQLPQENIVNYFLLTSHLNGFIESPNYYFDSDDNNWREALENLLLTQGWRRFKPENDKGVTVSKPSYLPETEGHIINGAVIDKSTNQPVSDLMVYLSIPGLHSVFQTSVTDKKGNFMFALEPYFGSSSLVLQTHTDNDSLYRITVNNSFYDAPVNTTVPALSFSKNLNSLLQKHSMSMQVQNAYAANKLNAFNAPYFSDTSSFYGLPDNTYLLDNYTRFNTMEEVLREYIPEVAVRIHNGHFRLLAGLNADNSFFNNDALVLMDGVPVFNMDSVIAYNPLKIKKIEAVAKKFYHNNLTCWGIISCNTYNGDLDGFTFPADALVLSYDGLQLQREFYSPQYNTTESTQSRVADYRNVLSWQPYLSTDATGKFSFYTSDMKGNFAVVVQGFYGLKKPVYKTLMFSVH